MKQPHHLSLVRFNFGDLPAKYDGEYPFERNAVYVFFGEIPNMPGHCVVANHKTGQIYSGYHIENFEELPEEEA